MNFVSVYDLNIARLERKLRTRQCERSLLEFTKDAWPQIESVPFKSGWHIECLCDHLEGIANRQIFRLLLNLPPRHCKSSIVSKIFPAFVWAQNPNPSWRPELEDAAIMPESWRGPGVKFLAISYREDLALEHSAAWYFNVGLPSTKAPPGASVQPKAVHRFCAARTRKVSGRETFRKEGTI